MFFRIFIKMEPVEKIIIDRSLSKISNESKVPMAGCEIQYYRRELKCIGDDRKELCDYVSFEALRQSVSNNEAIIHENDFEFSELDPQSESFHFGMALMRGKRLDHLPLAWGLATRVTMEGYYEAIKSRFEKFKEIGCQDDTFNDEKLLQWCEDNVCKYYGLLKGCLTVRRSDRLTMNEVDTLLHQLRVIYGEDVSEVLSKYNVYLEYISTKIKYFQSLVYSRFPKRIDLSSADKVNSDNINRACNSIASMLAVLSEQENTGENFSLRNIRNKLNANKELFENIRPILLKLESVRDELENKNKKLEELKTLMDEIPAINFTETVEKYDPIKKTIVTMSFSDKFSVFWEAYFFIKKNYPEEVYNINAVSFAHLIYLLHFSDDQKDIDRLVEFIAQDEDARERLISLYKMYIAMRESKVNQLMSIDAAKASIISMLEKLGYADVKGNLAKYRKVISRNSGKGNVCSSRRKTLIGSNLAEPLVTPISSKFNDVEGLLRKRNGDVKVFFELPKEVEECKSKLSNNHISELRKLKFKEKNVFDHRKNVLHIMQELINYIALKRSNCMSGMIWDFSWSHCWQDIFYYKRHLIIEDFMKFIKSIDEHEYKNIYEYYDKILCWLRSRENEIQKTSKKTHVKLNSVFDRLEGEIKKHKHPSKVDDDKAISLLVTHGMMRHSEGQLGMKNHTVSCR